MSGTDPSITQLEDLERRLERKLELLRGGIARLRGARTGARFGLGRGVRLLYPSMFEAGDDVTIQEFAYVNCLCSDKVRIGDGTSFGRNLWLDCGGKPENFGQGFFKIGSRSFIGCNAVLGAGGGITIGNNVLVGQSVNMHAENHVFKDPRRLIREQGVSYRGIVIEDDVWIGSQAVVLDGVVVGRGAVVAAGALVARDVPPMSVVAGVPAQVIRKRGMEQ